MSTGFPGLAGLRFGVPIGRLQSVSSCLPRDGIVTTEPFHRRLKSHCLRSTDRVH